MFDNNDHTNNVNCRRSGTIIFTNPGFGKTIRVEMIEHFYLQFIKTKTRKLKKKLIQI